MSTGLSTHNPIVLFGNIGPDVVKVSQIYDPDNDQYTISRDVVAQPNKSYYTRSYDNRTITFTPVGTIAVGANPKENGWYEENAAHADQTGKYVPAPKSIVVCDIDYGDFKARSILIVDSVDDQGENPTFKSILVPTTNGQDTETSARLVDFGNDRFMLYFEEESDGVIRVCPDRKLMLYGERHYSYKLCDSKGRSIAVPRSELIGVTTNALIPYSGETTTAFTLSGSTWDSVKGKFFTTIVSGGYHRSIIVPDRTSAASVYCKTLDSVYRYGQTYFVEEWTAEGERTFRQLTQGTTSQVNNKTADYVCYQSGGNTISDTVGLIREPGTNTKVNVGYDRIYVRASTLLGPQNNASFEGYITDISPDASIRYPERAYLKNGESLASGELVTMEVYEYEGDAYRMVLSIQLVAHPGTVLDATDRFSKQVDSFNVVVRNDEDDVLNNNGENDIYYLPVGQDISKWSFHPFIKFNDGSEIEVPVDHQQSFVYGLENISSANAGRQFKVLFKYFVTLESPLRENYAKNFLSKTITIQIAPTTDKLIRKISTIPLWNHTTQRYEFRFLPYTADFECPELIGQGKVYENSSVLGFTAAAYQDPNGNIKALDVVNIGSNMGVFMHARLSLTAKSEGYATDTYRQYVALRLQEWERNATAVKWLIGEYSIDTTPASQDSQAPEVVEYTADEVPYGSAAVGTRPYLVCTQGSAGEYTCYNLSIPTYFENQDRFLNNFFRNAYSAPVDVKGKSEIAPTSELLNTVNKFRLRSVATADIYDALSSTVALEGVVYYRTNGAIAEGVVPGKTVVTRYSMKVQDGFDYYFFNSTTNRYEEVTGLTVGSIITAEQRESYFIKRVKPIVSKWVDIHNYFTAGGREELVLEVDGVPVHESKYFATNMVGGPIPTVDSLGDIYNTQVMGLIVVEFANYDQENGVYKYVYGVPVEIRFPYTPTSDAIAQQEKVYYDYDPATNQFTESRRVATGDVIPIPSAEFQPLWEPYVPVGH